MKCICKNCKYCKVHTDGKICDKNLIFVQKDDYCEGFENDELFDPTKLIAFTIIAIGIVLICAKFL